MAVCHRYFVPNGTGYPSFTMNTTALL
jgi:hypothetical protein